MVHEEYTAGLFTGLICVCLYSRCLWEGCWSTWWASVPSVMLTPTAAKAAHHMTMDTPTANTVMEGTDTEGRDTEGTDTEGKDTEDTDTEGTDTRTVLEVA